MFKNISKQAADKAVIDGSILSYHVQTCHLLFRPSHRQYPHMAKRRKAVAAAASAASLLTTTPKTAISLASCRLPLSLDLSDLALLFGFHAEQIQKFSVSLAGSKDSALRALT